MTPGIWHQACCCAGGVNDIYIMSRVSSTDVVIAHWNGSAFDYETIQPDGGVTTNNQKLACCWDTDLIIAYLRSGSNYVWRGSKSAGSWSYRSYTNAGARSPLSVSCRGGWMMLWVYDLISGHRLYREDGSGITYVAAGLGTEGAQLNGVSTLYGYESPRPWVINAFNGGTYDPLARNDDVLEVITTATDARGQGLVADAEGKLRAAIQIDGDVMFFTRNAADNWSGITVHAGTGITGVPGPILVFSPAHTYHMLYWYETAEGSFELDCWYAVSGDGISWNRELVATWPYNYPNPWLSLIVDRFDQPVILRQPAGAQVQLWSGPGSWAQIAETEISGIMDRARACPNWNNADL